MKTDWRGIIIRAKEKGEHFLVLEPKNGEATIFCTESNNRLPDLISMGMIEIAKGIHKTSGGKYSPTAALEALLTHVNTVSRVAIEKYERVLRGELSEIPVELSRTQVGKIN